MGYGYGYGYGGMTEGLGLVTWAIVLVDLVLLGIWLYEQINKRK